MIKKIDLGNVITAMITPFKADNEQSVDFEKAISLANHLIQNGTDTLLLTGSTGEDAQLSPDEKWSLVQAIRQNTPTGTRIMVSTGDTNTQRAIAKARKAFDLGADAVLVNVPEYIKPSQEAMLIHFQSIARSIAPHPMMIYNIPGRTSAEMMPDTAMDLAYCNSNIIGIKQSFGNLDRVSEMTGHRHTNYSRSDFQVYSGDDSLTLPMLALGAKGVISVASHLKGNLIQQMIQEFKAGHVENAQKIHQSLFPLFKALFVETNPLPIKEAMYQKGMIESPCCRTLGQMSVAHQHDLNRILKIYDHPKRISHTPTDNAEFLNIQAHKLNLLMGKIQRSKQKE